jgi:hypothetical protein
MSKICVYFQQEKKNITINKPSFKYFFTKKKPLSCIFLPFMGSIDDDLVDNNFSTKLENM